MDIDIGDRWLVEGEEDLTLVIQECQEDLSTTV